MAFHERWFAEAKQRQLSEALHWVPTRQTFGGELVEVGSWEGASTIHIARTFPDSRLHVIDHWKGDLTDLRNGVAAKAAARDVFADFTANIEEAGVADRIVIHRAGWRDVLDNTWQLPIRMCFIDGQHTYDEVADNIDAVLPRLVPGGVICGDDYTFPAVARAVRDRLGPVGRPAKAAVWFWVRPAAS